MKVGDTHVHALFPYFLEGVFTRRGGDQLRTSRQRFMHWAQMSGLGDQEHAGALSFHLEPQE
jgi:hypothetical protein